MLTRDLVLKCILMFLLGGFQCFLGWFMVRSGLIEVPRVSHIRIAAHLVTAFLTAGYVWWVVLGLIYPQQASNKLTSLRKWSKALFFIIVVQIIYGAFVAGLRAGMVHNTFPLMDGVWIADAVTSMKPVITNFIEGRSGVQFVHRYIAYAVVIVVVVIWWKARGKQLDKAQKLAINLVGVMVSIQFLLGVFTLLMAVPVSLGVLHQLGAFFLLMSVIFLLHRLRPAI